MGTARFRIKRGEHGVRYHCGMRLWSAAVLASTVGLSHAQEMAGPDIPRVLTPARLDQPLSEVPASVTIITGDMIRASGARELYQVMRLVPGMSVAKADGNVPSVSYHGTQVRDHRRMLVLLDGRSVYRPGLARVNWNDLPIALEDVERIEVTRGPAAAAYGANAFSGVINIISRDPRDSEGQRVRLRAGNNGIRDAYVSGGWHLGDSAFRISVESRADDGYDAGLPPMEDGDAKRTQSVNSRGAWELDNGDVLSLYFGGSRSKLERAPESSLRGLGDYQRLAIQRDDSAFAGMVWERQLSDWHQLKVSGYAQYSDEELPLTMCYFDPLTGRHGAGGGLLFSKEMRDLYLAHDGDIDATLAAAPADPAVQQRYANLLSSGADRFCGTSYLDVREHRYDLEIQDTVQINSWARLVAGLNLRYDRGSSQTYLSGTADNVSRRAFANLALKPLFRFTANLGGYWEYDDLNGEHFTPRVGLSWQLKPGHHLRWVYARGLRSPDIYEDQAHSNAPISRLNGPFGDRTADWLGWDPAYFFVSEQADGNLKPERIRSREWGYYGHFGDVELDVRYFQEELWDLISGPISPVNFDADNSGKVSHRGTEAQLSWRPGAHHWLRLSGAHIHTRSNRDTELRFAARDSGSALWEWHVLRNWWLSSGYYLARDYNNHPYERLDLQLAYRRALGATHLEASLLVQHFLENEPVVFEENRYRADERFWLTLALRF